MTRFQRRSCVLATLAVLLAGALAFTACGDSESPSDIALGDAGASGDSSASGDASNSNDPIDGSSGSDESATGSLGGGGVVPEGSIEFGTLYTVMINPADPPTSLSIPPGSVTSFMFEAAATNSGTATLNSSDYSVSLFADAGATAEDEFSEIITARDEGLELTLTVAGVPGDEVTFMVENELQPDDPAGGDAPDIITDAIAITEPREGLLGGVDTTDYYVVDAPPGAVLTMDLESSAEGFGGVNASLEFNGENRGSLSAQPGGTEQGTFITSSDEGGAWYVRVQGAGAYSLDVAAVSQNDGGGQGDAGADPSAAMSVEPGSFPGLMGDSDTTDFFEFTLPDGAAITMTLANDPTSTSQTSARIMVNGTEEGRVSAGPGGSDSITLALAGTVSGVGIIEVWGGAALYEIDLGVGQQEDGGTPGDAGGDAVTAKRIDNPDQVGVAINGQMSSDDTADFYVVSVEELGPLAVSLSTAADATGGFSARVLIDGTEVERTTAAVGGTGQMDPIIIEAPGDIVIELWNGKGNYTVTVGEPGSE